MGTSAVRRRVAALCVAVLAVGGTTVGLAGRAGADPAGPTPANPIPLFWGQAPGCDWALSPGIGPCGTGGNYPGFTGGWMIQNNPQHCGIWISGPAAKDYPTHEGPAARQQVGYCG